MKAEHREIPPDLDRGARLFGRTEWLERLDDLVAEVAQRWSLDLGAPFSPGGNTAWVAPATGENGEELVVKVGWRDVESAHEADGLRFWGGDGAVRCFDAMDVGDSVALLLERCRPGWTLRRETEERQDEVVVELLSHLWRRPPDRSPFRPLAEMCHDWADRYEARIEAGARQPLDGMLGAQGIALFRSLGGSVSDGVVLSTDLHAGNVLASGRRPWLAIDPKPYVGDPAYDLVQHALNCSRLFTDPARLMRRLAGLAGLDGTRCCQWLFARCVQESLDWPELAGVARTLAPAATRA